VILNFFEKDQLKKTVGVSHQVFYKRKGTQTAINSIFKISEREDSCLEIALFFYNNAIPYDVGKSEEFNKMLELFAKHGPELRPPSYHEIRVKYLKQQVEKTCLILEKRKLFGKKWLHNNGRWMD